MNADNIKGIIEIFDKSPYECILIDGPWGIGKSYAIKQSLDTRDNVCNISMFGIKDAQEIYHEVFFQFIMKDNKKYGKRFSNLLDAVAIASNKITVAKDVIGALVKEKELFLSISKSFNTIHFIVIDDLERMNKNIELEEVFGVIDELKKCNYVKVVIVANTEELCQRDLFMKYCEKVIDRVYNITERPKNVDWVKLRIHSGFISEFLKNHNVTNLRTLEKAQNFYEDVKLKMKQSYREDFYDEIRLICFAVVVESIDGLRYKKVDNNQYDKNLGMVQKISDRLEFRVFSRYLNGIKISSGFVNVLIKYYTNKIELDSNEVDAEYQLFIHAGDKANFYKSDNELEQTLPKLAKKIREEENFVKMMKFADEYFIWSNRLNLDITQISNEYKDRLYDMMYTEIMDGKTEYMTMSIDIYHVQCPINNELIQEVITSIRNKIIEEYVIYLSKETQGGKAYQYSSLLKEFVENMHIKDCIKGKVDSLYNKKSFPVHVTNDTHYRTIYNIMYTLNYENKDKFLAYCDTLKKECDNMSAHRIDVLLERVAQNRW